MAGGMILEKADLPMEIVILLIGGMTMLIAGGLLFPVSAGSLPYYEDGLYGLLLMIFALQMITLGRTPFGDMRRSKPLLAAGSAIASMGIVISFIPGIFDLAPRLLLLMCFGPGGFCLLLQMCFSKDKLLAWMKYGGIFRQLTIGCAAVYGLSVVIALLVWQHGMAAEPTAMAVLAYGASIIYLAGVLLDIYHLYPEAAPRRPEDTGLSPEQAILLLTGIFMLLLGGLLIPVNLGLLPFSASAQLGLLMVIFAFQMLASGNTPIGAFPRSRLMIICGLLFAALGIVSCIIPLILVQLLTKVVGILNILGGVITLFRICPPHLRKQRAPASAASPLLTKLFVSQLFMNLLTIMFGLSMLVANLIPGLVIGAVLAANGGVLLYLLHIMIALSGLQRDANSMRS